LELRQLEPRAHRAGQAGLAAGRFALVPGDEEEFIPLPEKPKTVSYP
jgi:hypothetical protein